MPKTILSVHFVYKNGTNITAQKRPTIKSKVYLGDLDADC